MKCIFFVPMFFTLSYSFSQNLTVNTIQTRSSGNIDNLTINNGGVLTIDGPLTITGNININSGGRLIINANVPFEGNLTINGGATPNALLVAFGFSFGSSDAGNITINGGAVVDIEGTLINDGNFTTNGTLNVSGTLSVPNGNFTNNGSGSINLTGNIDVDNGNFDNNGNITIVDPGNIDVNNGNTTNNGTIDGTGTFEPDLGSNFTNNGTFFDCVGSDLSSCCTGGVCSNSALPIELLSFSLEPNSQSIMVNWATATEINNDFFTIERSRDAFTFEPIAQVQGVGNSTEIIRYSYEDRRPLSGLSYYRLRQTDFDGTNEVFQIRPIEFSGSISAFSILGNPVQGSQVSIFNALDDDRYECSMYSLTGELLSKSPLEPGENLINIPGSKSTGLMIVQVRSPLGEKVFSERIILN